MTTSAIHIHNWNGIVKTLHVLSRRRVVRSTRDLRSHPIGTRTTLYTSGVRWLYTYIQHYQKLICWIDRNVRAIVDLINFINCCNFFYGFLKYRNDKFLNFCFLDVKLANRIIRQKCTNIKLQLNNKGTLIPYGEFSKNLVFRFR